MPVLMVRDSFILGYQSRSRDEEERVKSQGGMRVCGGVQSWLAFAHLAPTLQRREAIVTPW